ncbi:MAG: HlyD family efflux transporter periplasmic adaptor subunit [Phycisphaeraceae bacterium]|nr:MAG: HlyD family efflux transporter periplasmic adaptor subunit [Phycisphaeraceae bacterium]
MTQPNAGRNGGRGVGGSSRCRGGSLARVVVSLVIVAGVAGGGYWVLRDDDGSGGHSGPDVVQVSRSGFDISTTSNGELEARNQIEIRNKLESPSTIVEVVPEGTRVRAGDLLVRLNSDQLTTQVEQAELELTSARSKWQASQHAYEIQEIDNEQRLRQALLKLELAGLEYNQWLEGEVKTKRQSNQLALSRSGLEVDRLAEKLSQSYDLWQKGFLSKDEYDRDMVSYIEAQSAWITATLNADIFENFEFEKNHKKHRSEIDDAAANVEQVRLNNRIQLDARSSERENDRRSVELRESRLNKLKEQVEAATVRAPSEGLVVHASSMSRFSFGPSGDGPMQIGRQVYPNELIMVLPDTSEMIAAVRVHESLASRVRPGLKAEVKIDAAGGRVVPGVIESIGVLAETTNWRDPNLKEYTVKIGLDRSAVGGDLKPSMRAEARLILDRVEDAVAVPAQAVFSEGVVRFVYRVEGAKLRRQPVRLGRQSDTLAEILTGLDPGARVLTREPSTGKVIREPWDPAALAACGYEIGDDGQPRLASNGRGGGGGRARGPGGGRGGPEATDRPEAPNSGDARPDGEVAGGGSAGATDPAAPVADAGVVSSEPVHAAPASEATAAPAGSAASR